VGLGVVCMVWPRNGVTFIPHRDCLRCDLARDLLPMLASFPVVSQPRHTGP
jgi:hypothetical protein